MPFGWKGKSEPAAQPAPLPEPVAEPPPGVLGDQPCSERGCARQDAAACKYVDRRGRPCPTAWCVDHQQVFDGLAFCRRHVGTLKAIGLDIVNRSLAPDLDNRAPSLVNWICNDLDERVRALLLEQKKPASGEELGEERVHLIRSADGARTWARSWKLFDHRGPSVKVTVSVGEADDSRVTVGVAQQDSVSEVPPWIKRRREGRTVTPEEDLREREAFYATLFGSISAAVVLERSGEERGHW